MKISYGNSRFETKWKNSEISWEDFKRRVSSTIRTTETIEEYRNMTKAQQADVKDKGGFVAGHLKGGSRKKNTVLCRYALALDMDYGTPEVWDEVIAKQPYSCCAYSTHKHTPENPRLRIVIPLSRDVSEAEYPAVARMTAKDIGIDLFDDSTYEAHRLMYWPSTSMNGEFFYREKDGCELDPDLLLSRYDDWQDESTWPVSSRQSAVEHHGEKEMADPLSKPGIVGTFCRAYSMTGAIDTFLYKKTKAINGYKKENLYRIYSEKEINNLNQKYVNRKNSLYLNILDSYLKKYDIKFTSLVQNFQISKTILTKLKNGENWWFGQIPEIKFIFSLSTIFISDIKEFNETIINTFDLLLLINTCNYNKQEYIIKNISLIDSMLRYELASNKFQDLHEYKNSKEFLIARYVHRIDYINQLKDATLK